MCVLKLQGASGAKKPAQGYRLGELGGLSVILRESANEPSFGSRGMRMGPVYDRVQCGWRVVAAVLGVCLPGCAAKPPYLTARDVEAVEIQLENWREQQKAAKVSSTDAAKIDALLALLRSGEPTRDHKCGDSGQITLRRRDGNEVKIGILAGHDRRYYELRVYRGSSYEVFRVERVPFLKEIGAFGVEGLDPGSPE
jgi:hypothetical protein